MILIEYYLDLLARAVDEHRLRLDRRQEEARDAEIARHTRRLPRRPRHSRRRMIPNLSTTTLLSPPRREVKAARRQRTESGKSFFSSRQSMRLQ